MDLAFFHLQAISSVDVSAMASEVKQQWTLYLPSFEPRYPSPGSMVASFRGGPGSTSAYSKVLPDLPWTADVAVSEERAGQQVYPALAGPR